MGSPKHVRYFGRLNRKFTLVEAVQLFGAGVQVPNCPFSGRPKIKFESIIGLKTNVT